MTTRRPPPTDRVVDELAALLRPGGSGPVEPMTGWQPVLDLAADHQLLPALWSSLVARGVRPLPAPLRTRGDGEPPLAVLHAAYAENAARVRDLQEQGAGALTGLHAAGIDALPVKGLHWLLAGWQPDPASRVMVDVDVVVPPGQARAAIGVLHDLGYATVPTDDPEGMADHEEATFERAGCRGSLELQTAPLVARYASVATARELFDAAVVVPVDGRDQRLPSPTHGMLLALAHAQLQDECWRLRMLPMRTLRDVAVVLSTGIGHDVDWGVVEQHFARAGARRALAGVAVASAELFGVELPVSTRGGSSWLWSVRRALRHPSLAHRYRELVTLPRALSAARMERLYGARTAPARASARVRHVARGAGRRVPRLRTTRAR